LLDGIKGKVTQDSYKAWRQKLAEGEAAKRASAGANKYAEDGDIHPVRMLEEVRDFAKRDAILCVDGQETLNFGRQTMPTYSPGHRLNSGPFGTMGVGLPFGVGAKVACPDKQVIVVHGDGSLGMNFMEVDTAIRHKIPLLIVVSLNGGWTGDPKREKPGRDLGYMRYDKMCEALGGYGEYITKPEDIRGALERGQAKVDEGGVALINVRTDYRARYGGVRFSDYST
jgi:thiamine pyrophosphate-dependent acetolactate synthase large subunit-like protein